MAADSGPGGCLDAAQQAGLAEWLMVPAPRRLAAFAAAVEFQETILVGASANR